MSPGEMVGGVAAKTFARPGSTPEAAQGQRPASFPLGRHLANCPEFHVGLFMRACPGDAATALIAMST